MIQAQKIFDQLWSDYINQNPEAKRVYDLLISEGETVVNDHIALRTFDDPRISIDVLAKPFIEAGYEYKGDYVFEEKKLIDVDCLEEILVTGSLSSFLTLLFFIVFLIITLIKPNLLKT